MKKRMLSLLLAFVMALSLATPSWAAEVKPEVTNNIALMGDYDIWGFVPESYLSNEKDGLMRVEFIESEGKVVVEYYDASFNIKSQRYIDAELPMFGGFYSGKDANYLVFGQYCDETAPLSEAFRVVKYSKSWQRLGSCSLDSANTTRPFDAGSCRMVEQGGYLYIRTCHQITQKYDGINHQTNMSILVRTSDMTLADRADEVEHTKYGYASHSFNQFVIADDSGTVVGLDHADAHPRAVVLSRFKLDASGGKGDQLNVLSYPGVTGENRTGVSVGGFDYSSTSYIVTGSTVETDSAYNDREARNVFVATVDRNNYTASGVKVTKLTSYDRSGSMTVSAPYLIKLGADRFMIMWQSGEHTDFWRFDTWENLNYAYLNGKGELQGEIHTVRAPAAYTSDCKPVVYNGSVVWYSTANRLPVFYKIDANGVFSAKHYETDDPTEFGVPHTPHVTKTVNTDGTITLDWPDQVGVQNYTVYSSYTQNGEYKVAMQGSSSSEFTTDYVDDGKTIYYYVVANAYRGYVSAKSDIIEHSFKNGPMNTAVVSTEVNDEGKINVFWPAVRRASRYEVYRAESENGTYSLVSQQSATSYLDPNTVQGRTYYYYVIAIDRLGNRSDKSNVASSSGMWKLKYYNATSGKPYVYADKVQGADSYALLRADSKNDYFSVIYTNLDSPAVVDSSAATGLVYYYRLAAYDANGKLLAMSTTAEVVSRLSPPALEARSVNGAVELNWSAVQGADGYMVWRIKPGRDGDIADVDTEPLEVIHGDATSFVDKTGTKGTTYTYYVRATKARQTDDGLIYDDSGPSNEVTITYGGEVLPNTPIIKGSNNQTSGKPTLRWDAISGAAKYEIYRAPSENGDYEPVWTVTGTSYTNTGAEPGNTYYYKVRSINSDGTASVYSNVVKLNCLCATPTLKTSFTDDGIVNLEWSSVDGAQYYRAYRKQTGTTTYASIVRSYANSYADDKGKVGVSYDYTLVAVDEAGRESAKSNMVTATRKASTYAVGTPVVKAGVDANGNTTLTWNETTNATWYYIYRAESENGEYEQLMTQVKTSFTDTDSSKTYYYKVKASDDSSRYSEFSKPVTRPELLKAPKVSAGNNPTTGKNTLTWQPVDGAAKYEIWRCGTKGGNYSKMWTQSATTYTNTSSYAGYTYYYKVRALDANGVGGAFSEIVSRTCDLPAPVISGGNNASTGKNTLTWKAVDGASKYKVYRATSKNGSYSLMSTQSSTSYTNTSAKAGYTYYYKVVAVSKKTQYADSAYSNIVSRTCDCAKPTNVKITTSNGKPRLTWSKVDGVGTVSYTIYRATSANGTYTKMYTTQYTSYVNTSAKAGTSYYYKIVATSSQSSYSQSAYSSVVSVKATK